MTDFKVGDLVIAKDSWGSSISAGATYQVQSISEGGKYVRVTTNEGISGGFWPHQFHLKGDVLSELRRVLDKVRAEGYDVKVTLTTTKTEEL